MMQYKNFYIYLSGLMLLFATAHLNADTYVVDLNGTYTSIQAAVDVAAAGDTILLTAGQTFTGIGNKNIELSIDLTFGVTGEGANPVIDMEGDGRLFSIDFGVTVTMCNLEIKNGNSGKGGAIYNEGTLTAADCIFSGNSATDDGGAIANYAALTAFSCTFSGNSTTYDGGAIYNHGTLTVADCGFTANTANYSGGAIYTDNGTNTSGCTFSGNSANSGGAIYNDENASLDASSCDFSGNAASYYGGAVYNYSATMTVACSRFVGNQAANGSAIYADQSTVDAENNWWGTNTDPSTIENLLVGDNIDANPWITMGISANPPNLLPGQFSTITVDFTKSGSCTIPDGVPVIFTATDGIITASIAATLDGSATITLEVLNALPKVCATTDDQTVCRLLNTGYARLNWGCVCTDSGNQHILVGSYNDPEETNNQLRGWVFVESTCTTITPLDLSDSAINNVAVYNHDDIVYIALLTRAPESNFQLRLVTCSDNGSGYEFISSDTVINLGSASKVQWIVGLDGIPYIAVDAHPDIQIYSAALDTLSLSLNSTTTNMAGSSQSTFLYWAPQGGNLYLVQGYDSTKVATCQVNSDGGTFIGAGVETDVSGDFNNVNSCATCNNYLTLGGSNSSSQGKLAQYSVNATTHQLDFAGSTTLDATTVNYCERCCCDADNLLVGTDNGLYSLDSSTYDFVASNTIMANNNWLNGCWCCDDTNIYCAAVDGNHDSFIFKQEAPNLTLQCAL